MPCFADDSGFCINALNNFPGVKSKRYLKNNLLNNKTIIGTEMTNKGLENYLNTLGLELERTKVGDRYVIEKMKSFNSNLGGEGSGHIIIGDYGSTGDGLIAALQIIACMKEENRSASFLRKEVTLFPQFLDSIKYNSSKIFNLQKNSIINEIRQETEKKLGENGRILIRLSGTEKKIRIMGESKQKKVLDETMKKFKLRISKLIKEYEKN